MDNQPVWTRQKPHKTSNHGRRKDSSYFLGFLIAACAAALDGAGRSGAYTREDLCSKARMLDLCKEQLTGAAFRDLDDRLTAARARAAGMTAWRIEGTLREFARFDPVNLWFDYPVHRLDTGLLDDLEPDSDFKALGARGAAKRWGDKEKLAREKKNQLANAFEACTMDGAVTIYAMAEYLDLKPETVKKRLRADGGYWIEEGKVGRKELGSAG